MDPNYVRLYASTLQGRKRRPIVESGDMGHPGTIVTLNLHVLVSVELSQAPAYSTCVALSASDRHQRFSLASTSPKPGGNNAEDREAAAQALKELETGNFCRYSTKALFVWDLPSGAAIFGASTGLRMSSAIKLSSDVGPLIKPETPEAKQAPTWVPLVPLLYPPANYVADLHSLSPGGRHLVAL
ncbi:uncharacterized protein PAC_00750 [Phialocephala subalpina]|uniref:Uncharacterized protein n=1 Tax=Phialocephala subalpina TaxID=576137 RepID=A0A1L7WDL4_9HELO|nr:uncharacterized protein PAC_00750 [Phialocephala subalpina]